MFFKILYDYFVLIKINNIFALEITIIMNEQKKLYTPLNLPKGLVERLKVLKAAYAATYIVNASYEDIIEGMIEDLATTDKELYDMYTKMLQNIKLGTNDKETEKDNSRIITFLRDATALKNIYSIEEGELMLFRVIQKVLEAAGEPMTYTEITKCVNASGLYHRADNSPIPANQVVAVIKYNTDLFNINDSVCPKKISLNK